MTNEEYEAIMYAIYQAKQEINHPAMEKLATKITCIADENPPGEWIKVHENPNFHYFKCSKCGRWVNVEPKLLLEEYPYCHCGARMTTHNSEE